MIRLFILASALFFALTTHAKDMSTWSDRTMCRLAPELATDSHYQWHLDKRGLMCTDDGFYREARYVTQSGICVEQPTSLEPMPAKPFFSADYLPQSNLSFTTKQQPLLLAQADFNADGLADFLLASNRADSQLSLLYGQIDGKLKQHELPHLTGLAAHIRGAKIADLNADKLVDFIVYGDHGQHWQFINLGNGFEASQISALGNENHILDVHIADINLDQLPDLIPVRAGTDTLKSPLANTAQGFQLVEQSYSPAINNAHVTAVTAGDYNKDGFTDLAFSEDGKHNQLIILLGDQDLNNRDNQFLILPGVEHTTNYSRLHSSDLNNDGYADIIHAYTYAVDEAIEVSAIRLFINQQGCFTDATATMLPDYPQALAQTTSTSAIGNIQVIDINHDGLNDLLIQHQQAQTEGVVLLNSGNQYLNIELTDWHADQQRLAGDINGDQMIDLIALQQHKDGRWQVNSYLHPSPLTTPFAPAIPVDFDSINEGQKAALDGFLGGHLMPAISLADALKGTSMHKTRVNTKVAWHLIPKQAPHDITFLGLDDVSMVDDNWQILTKEVYFFYPTRDHRDSLVMHSNRQDQIILRGHMHVTPKERRQDIEIFGHRNNSFAMGVLDKGDLLLLEFLP